MALRPASECGNLNLLNLCNADKNWSGKGRHRSRYWGTTLHFNSTAISNPGCTVTAPSPSLCCVCFREAQQRLFPTHNISVCENGASSSLQCSLPFVHGLYHDVPVAFQPPCQAFSSRISSQLQTGLITLRRPGRWVCFGGGPRPRRPRVWKTRQRRGSVSKSQKLLNHVRSLSNVKEEVYGALDSFIAWEVEFPLIAVKKALYTLRSEKNWKRIIQISKWMLGKGQGKTLGTYLLLLDAFDHEGRVEEAQELWERVLTKNLGHTPRNFFALMISMFDRLQMYDELLEVFADMEELDVKPTPTIVNKVALTYQKIGISDKAEKVLKKYPPPMVKYHTANGKIIKFRASSTPCHEKRNLPEGTDSYGSSAYEESLDNTEEEDFGILDEGDNDTGISQAVTEEEDFGILDEGDNDKGISQAVTEEEDFGILDEGDNDTGISQAVNEEVQFAQLQ